MCIVIFTQFACVRHASKTSLFALHCRLSAHTQQIIFFRARGGHRSPTLSWFRTAPTKHAFCIVFHTCTKQVVLAIVLHRMWNGGRLRLRPWISSRLRGHSTHYGLSWTLSRFDWSTDASNKSSTVVFSVTTCELFAYWLDVVTAGSWNENKWE